MESKIVLVYLEYYTTKKYSNLMHAVKRYYKGKKEYRMENESTLKGNKLYK